MEQLVHVFGIDWQQLLVQGVNFMLLLGVLSYFLYRPILNLMNQRQMEIEEGVRAARDAEEDRERARVEHTAKITEAEHEAEAIVDRAVEEAKQKEAVLLTEARTKEDRIVADAERRAKELARKIEGESHERVARAAILAAEKILTKELSKQ